MVLFVKRVVARDKLWNVVFLKCRYYLGVLLSFRVLFLEVDLVGLREYVMSVNFLGEFDKYIGLYFESLVFVKCLVKSVYGSFLFFFFVVVRGV